MTKGVEMVEATVVQLVENPMDAAVADALERRDLCRWGPSVGLQKWLSGLGSTR